MRDTYSLIYTYGSKKVSLIPLSEGGNKSSFRNVVSFKIPEDGEVKIPVMQDITFRLIQATKFRIESKLVLGILVRVPVCNCLSH
jgi:hypothetical protein